MKRKEVIDAIQELVDEGKIEYAKCENGELGVTFTEEYKHQWYRNKSDNIDKWLKAQRLVRRIFVGISVACIVLSFWNTMFGIIGMCVLSLGMMVCFSMYKITDVKIRRQVMFLDSWEKEKNQKGE